MTYHFRDIPGGRGFTTKRVDITSVIWEFPKIRGTLFWGPYNESYYLGYDIRVPCFWKLPHTYSHDYLS